ncbi:unnamed protein product (macronuclear) [Paramecium tetraurelia]|uniref:PX domain-containing protein n=1 Tax=Paramecium tetraurelia TaxID=5888 RepID=A0C5C2_PARTE|nr:uncharacterized protein GSPATT00006488001 [Paramecium tetraurelia]CAK65989.1 unnamed protein product [Paramecium tetraurelia]|eukprot:XP_001433386.1 hypothetical protein (macronuclear) [Paramecium tetraurelia strain d4-2]
MDNELIDIPIDYDEPKLESQESQQGSQETVSQIISLTPTRVQSEINQKSNINIIKFHLTEQVSQSYTQYYENISYVLCSQINDEQSNTVHRKYTHFEWLNGALKREFPGLLIPAIPPKTVLAKINLTEQTSIIREKRYKQLEEFLNKIKDHPQLQVSSKFLIFLTGSSEVMQQELLELSQYQNYAYQLGSAIANAGSKAYDIAKGSFNYLSSFIYTGQQNSLKYQQYPEQEIQQDVKECFESWEDLLIEEQQKVKRIFEQYQNIVNIKQEQNEDTRKVISSLKELEHPYLEKDISKTEASCSINEAILNEIKVSVIFKLELCILDIDEAMGTIKRRSELIYQIQQQIKIHNQIESVNEKIQYKEQIRENQKLLKTIETNFQNDIKIFANWLNKYLDQLIRFYNEQFQKLYREQNKNWNE